MHYRRPNTDTRLSPYAPYRIYVAESVAGKRSALFKWKHKLVADDNFCFQQTPSNKFITSNVDVNVGKNEMFSPFSYTLCLSQFKLRIGWQCAL